jgi:ADP-ribose pyrophosphatase YjhB (NUDIX family)
MRIRDPFLRTAAWAIHPKSTVGALVVCVDPPRILLVKQRHGEALWGFPGGFLRRGEAPATGALREVQEETGLTLAESSLHLAGLHRQPWARHYDVVFHATIDSGHFEEPHPGDTFEVMAAEWLRLDDLPPLRREARYVVEMYPTLFPESPD